MNVKCCHICSVSNYGNCECWCLYYDRDYDRVERWNLGVTSIYDTGYRHLCSTRIRLLGWRYLCSVLNYSCMSVGTCVRLWITVVWMLKLVFGFELQSYECWNLCSALNYSPTNVGTCVRLWITVVRMLELVFGFELQSYECWNLCSALNYSRMNVGTCVRLWITVEWMLELVFGFELQSSECQHLFSARDHNGLMATVWVKTSSKFNQRYLHYKYYCNNDLSLMS
jgi:hypothetical protein